MLPGTTALRCCAARSGRLEHQLGSPRPPSSSRRCRPAPARRRPLRVEGAGHLQVSQLGHLRPPGATPGQVHPEHRDPPDLGPPNPREPRDISPVPTGTCRDTRKPRGPAPRPVRIPCDPGPGRNGPRIRGPMSHAARPTDHQCPEVQQPGSGYRDEKSSADLAVPHRIGADRTGPSGSRPVSTGQNWTETVGNGL